ncbi:hypothetical protein SAMN05443999_107143 [Roseovarius azorensis]|uniref:YtkA-like n=1 Tax=Roseovarius azorensis TaxID=1287727 RepID=A0A1H7SIM6_9RHOB|nr:hypothetical protein [Roseovarius azorensis]SEL72355.1 hypothetical protein SAMN05443999_107143 [Roseovarius azorensis]
MKTKLVTILIALGVTAITGIFLWGALRTPTPGASSGNLVKPTAVISETLSDGRLDVQVYATGDRDVRLEIQFVPDANAPELAGMRPEVYFAMVYLHRDGFDSPLETVEADRWRAKVKLPMAGRWVVSVGFGEEFAEVEFDAR